MTEIKINWKEALKKHQEAFMNQFIKQENEIIKLKKVHKAKVEELKEKITESYINNNGYEVNLIKILELIGEIFKEEE